MNTRPTIDDSEVSQVINHLNDNTKFRGWLRKAKSILRTVIRKSHRDKESIKRAFGKFSEKLVGEFQVPKEMVGEILKSLFK